MGAWYASATGHGLAWEDISGQNNHGTVDATLSPACWTDSDNGWGIDLSGKHPAVSAADAPSLQCTAGFTVTTRWRLDTYQRYTGIYKGLSAINRNYNYRICGENTGYTIGACSASTEYWVNTGIAISYGSWETVTLTGDGTILRFYVNGAHKASKAAAGPYDGFAGYSLKIAGGTYSGSLFDGAIEYTLIYDRALDAEDVKRLCHEPYGHVWVPGLRSTWWFSAAAASSIPAIAAHYRKLRSA